MVNNYYLGLLFNLHKIMTTVTVNPEVDFIWAKDKGFSLFIWDKPLPLWLAEKISSNLDEDIEVKTIPSLRFIRKKVKGYLSKFGYSKSGDFIELSNNKLGLIPVITTWDETATASFQQVLPGRIVTEREISFLLQKIGINLSSSILEQMLQIEVLRGNLRRKAGVGLDEIGRYQCRRCGERKRLYEEYWATSLCIVCDACRSMGVVTSLTPLYQWHGIEAESNTISRPELILPTMTPWQNGAIKKILDFWKHSENNSFLVWAVCGAGKTEVVFPVIQEALSEGKRVLFTVPRREIIRELSERIKLNFPGLEFSVLYGGEKHEPLGAKLVLATTHQLLRFGPAFHLAILDEADAFPYRGNQMLIEALARTILPDGKIIYMTATPDDNWRKKVKRNEVAFARIVLRHHGHPLPVPEIKKIKLPPIGDSIPWETPQLVGEFITKISEKGRKSIFFLPTISLVEKVGYALKEYTKNLNYRVDFIHSRDEDREKKIKKFESKELNGLISSTLLERGLTFPNLDVVVLYADYEQVFQVETLVQIAGRVGRKAMAPSGDILFIAEKKTRSMIQAIDWINDMNKEAEELGYLKIKN